MSARIPSEWERHRTYPEPDGGILWFRRPVFDRADHYTMLIAIRALGACALLPALPERTLPLSSTRNGQGTELVKDDLTADHATPRDKVIAASFRRPPLSVRLVELEHEEALAVA